MERQLKLIWDFRGPAAEKTAAHHEIHLKEYLKHQKLSLDITGVEMINDMHHLAYMVVMDSEMRAVRDALKPHRGTIYNSELGILKGIRNRIDHDSLIIKFIILNSQL